MLFSAAGISMRRRTSSFCAMIMWPSASAAAAPPMSFFISSMPLAGLMSRPPVSKVMPLPTSVTVRAPSRPQVRSMRRGARGLARPTAWIIGKFLASRSSPTMTLDVRAVPGREVAGGGLDLGRAEVGGRRVDEVAAEPHRVDRC